MAAFVAFFVTAGTGAAASLPATHLAIERTAVTADSASFRVRVVEAGAPVAIVLPSATRAATLSIDGVVVQRAGWELYLVRNPFGHAIATFVLADARPGARIAIAEVGTNGDPRVADLASATEAYRVGLASGAFYGILAMAGVFQGLLGLRRRDPTLLWYAAWIGANLAIEIARDGFLPLTVVQREASFVAADVALTTTYAGFAASFLQLYTKARPLFWLYIAANVGAQVALVASTRFATTTNEIVAYKIAFVLVSLAIIAAVRRRAGFRPATYVLCGVVGLLGVLVVKIACNAFAIAATPLEWWGIDFGTFFDLVVFMLGTLSRTRFEADRQRELEADLREATRAASVDPLTGIANRRGFDAAVRQGASGTLLFADLDGFKAVNDLGGHAAGDATLRRVARILRHAVRERDTLARVGGDEFVVFLEGCDDSTIVASVVDDITTAIGFLRPLGGADGTRVGISVGSAYLAADGSVVEALALADAEAYRIKREHAEHRRRATVDGRLRRSGGPPGEAELSGRT